MPKITHNRAFPHENDEFDILVGTFDEDGRGDEDDTSYGFDDADDLGFKGNDVISFNFQGTDGNDQFFGGPNDDTLKGGKGLDALYGEGGNDWIYGGADRDWLFGGDNNDHLYGEGGPDDLYGDSGDDWLYGGELNDFLDGGSGDDTLVGELGADWLTGGSGSDTFQIICKDWLSIDSTAIDPDLIMDFSANDGDYVHVDGYGLHPDSSQYAEATIGYGDGYDAAKQHAEYLISADNNLRYVFVTDEVDGYLFVDWDKGDGEGGEVDELVAGVEVGIILAGLKSESDFGMINMIL